MRNRFSIIVVLLALACSIIRIPLPAIAQGQVYPDTMDAQAAGLRATASDDPAITYTYQNGQFLVQATEPSFQGELTSCAGVPEMASSRLTIDVSLGGDTNGKYVLAGCSSSATSDGYALGLAPGPTLAPTTAALPPPAPTAVSGPAIPPIQASGVLGPVFERERSAALAHTPFGDLLWGDLIQADNLYVWATSGHGAADFYTIVTFVNPPDLSTPSDVGIGFRDASGPESGFRFIVTSNGEWYIEQAGQTPYDSGIAQGFDPSPGASNVVELIAHGATGLVAVDGVVLNQIDLSAVNTRGEVYIGSGFLSGNTVPNRVVRYLDWWVYPIDILDVKSG